MQVFLKNYPGFSVFQANLYESSDCIKLFDQGVHVVFCMSLRVLTQYSATFVCLSRAFCFGQRTGRGFVVSALAGLGKIVAGMGRCS